MEKMSMGTFGPKGPPEGTAMVNPFNIEAIMRPHTNNRFVFAQFMLDGWSNNGLPRVKADSVSSNWLAENSLFDI